MAPEFAAVGKEAITLRHVLSHQAGLPGIAEPLPDGAMLDWPRMVRALERQPPWWTPGTAHGYDVNTFGWLVGEAVRRAAGVTLGALLRAPDRSAPTSTSACRAPSTTASPSSCGRPWRRRTAPVSSATR